MTTHKQTRFSFKPPVPAWPPTDLRLPDIIEQIEKGRPEPTEPRDNSREGRIARLCSIPGVATADTLPPPGLRYCADKKCSVGQGEQSPVVTHSQCYNQNKKRNRKREYN